MEWCLRRFGKTRPSCLSLRRRSLARWRRWTDGQAWPLRPGGPRQAGTRAATRSIRGSCWTVRLTCARTHRCWQKARCWPPPVRLCADGRGSLWVAQQAFILQLTGRVPCPLLSDTQRVRLSREPAMGPRRTPSPAAPRCSLRAHPPAPRPGARTAGSAPPSGTCPPHPAPAGPGLGLGGQGPCGASLNCTCHRVPSTQLVSCLPLCGSGDGAPSALPPPSSFPERRLGSAGPGPLPSKGPCKYVHFSGQGQWGAAPAHFSCADLYNYLFKGTWIIMK